MGVLSIAYCTVFVYQLCILFLANSRQATMEQPRILILQSLFLMMSVPFLAVGHHITCQVNESAMFNSPKMLLILYITAPGVMELHCWGSLVTQTTKRGGCATNRHDRNISNLLYSKHESFQQNPGVHVGWRKGVKCVRKQRRDGVSCCGDGMMEWWNDPQPMRIGEHSNQRQQYNNNTNVSVPVHLRNVCVCGKKKDRRFWKGWLMLHLDEGRRNRHTRRKQASTTVWLLWWFW